MMTDNGSTNRYLMNLSMVVVVVWRFLLNGFVRIIHNNNLCLRPGI